jgi:16S rRNA (guanine966-N2)-methyltransferase
MRVVSGSAKGRPLKAALPSSVRPTTDRVKEAIFDILGSMGGVAGLRVLDLFAGSGALGIEALSRGAASVIFVDADQVALRATRANVEALGMSDGPVTFVQASLPTWTPPGVDLVLVDPPYGFEQLQETLALISASTMVVESRDEPIVPTGWVSHRQRRYGGTLVTVLINEQQGEGDQ